VKKKGKERKRAPKQKRSKYIYLKEERKKECRSANRRGGGKEGLGKRRPVKRE